VNPNVSNKNYSMKTLEKFSNNGVYIDIWKTDWVFFHEVFNNWDYQALYDVIEYNKTEYNISQFVIERIETEEQHKFALQLEKDFPGIDFLYQWYLFDQDKYKKTNS
jgi:6-pyruvoyl-tetrahydropterin synthase